MASSATTEPQGARFFSESQPWRAVWSGWLIGTTGVFLFGFFGYAFYQQFICDMPFGGRPAPDGVLLFFGLLMMLLGAGLLWLAFGGRLETEVREGAVWYRHYPLTGWKRWPYEEIATCEPRTYRPILEYGGWGIRGGLPGKGMAYNVSGNRGVQLLLKNGKKFLLGSNSADELAAAIREQMQKCSPAP